MHLVYSLEEPPRSFSSSMFLAGPTPRSLEVESWRPHAIEVLKKLNYDGVIFIPENRNNNYGAFDHGLYPEWEHRMMNMSDLILFWVPRNLAVLSDGQPAMPALTTNVEYGLSAHLGKTLFGPPQGERNRYLSFVAKKFRIPEFDLFEAMAAKALEMIGKGATRTGGEREIPLQLWNTKTFQAWYQNQKQFGNYLDGAKIQWIYKIGPNKDRIFYWLLHPNIHIASENRNKTNEAFISRFDISSVLLYKRRKNILNSDIILVREFRSPVRNSNGFVWELPGGSSLDDPDPLQTASDEVFEETGLKIDRSRFKFHMSRQMTATLSSHHGQLYSVELTEEELSWCKSQKGIPHGSDYPDNPTGERAYTEVATLAEIIKKDSVDWSNIGMIFQALELDNRI